MIKECLYDKEYVCPVCKSEFKTKKVKSNSIKIVNRESDFRATYEQDNPTYYGVNVCPECGHARFESDFNDVNEASIQLIKKTISQKWKKKNYCNERSLEDAIEVHKLALLNYNITHYKLSAIAKVCLRLSWFYRGIDHEQELKFTKHTVETYEKAYVSENLDENPKEELTILYLLGELNRRLGNFKKAIDWFFMGSKSPVINEEKFISSELKDQMFKVKNEYKALKESKK